jgi:hypothetical protein
MIANAKDFRIVERHGDLAVAKKLVGNRGFTLIRMAGNVMVTDLAHRQSETEIRKVASRVHREGRIC